jgi:hypothetical protein
MSDMYFLAFRKQSSLPSFHPHTNFCPPHPSYLVFLVTHQFIDILTNCLLRTESLLFKLDKEDVLIVASANNHAEENEARVEITRYPAKFSDPDDKYGGIVNMVVVSAADWKTQRASFSQYDDYVTTFAPGNDIACPADPFLQPNSPYIPCDGTSVGRSTIF